MLDKYKVKEPIETIEVALEKEVTESLKKMEQYKKIPVNVLLNTAAKYFIAKHSDFFPPRKESDPTAHA